MSRRAPTDWSSKVALVTGGTSGIGRAVVGELAARGSAVAVCARSREGVESTVRALESASARAIGAIADVRDKRDVEAAVGATLAAFGRIDLLVNSAGVAGAAPSETLDEAEWDRIVDTNLRSEEHTSELQSRLHLVCRLLLEKKKSM